MDARSHDTCAHADSRQRPGSARYQHLSRRPLDRVPVNEVGTLRSVRAAPRTSGTSRLQVTTQRAYRPLWSADMRELFFDDGTRQLFGVPIRTEPTFAVTGPAVALPIKG